MVLGEIVMKINLIDNVARLTALKVTILVALIFRIVLPCITRTYTWKLISRNAIKSLAPQGI